MLKIRNFLLALGIVAFGFAVLEFAIEWRMLPGEISIFVFIGSMFLILAGIIVRSIGKSRAAKKIQ